MDIRTKLIFALVAVSLGSMFVLGAVVSPRVQGYIRDVTLRQLDQLTEAKTESLHWIVAGWRDAADLVASRTRLRARLDDYQRTGDPAAPDEMADILADALTASRSALLLEVYGADGEVLATVERGSPVRTLEPGSVPTVATTETVYTGVSVPDDGPPQVTLVAPMSWDERPIGALLAVFEAPELLELTGNHRGLGDTGETLIVADVGGGALSTLHPTRHGGSAGLVRLPSGPGSLAARALSGEPAVLGNGVRDYRDAEVWAATRPVEETGWGVVVKIDRDEGIESIVEFNEWLGRTALILAAFTIVLGLVLALRFALPIHSLAEVADRIREGELTARADIAREDEIGLLARTFNDMADDLEQRIAQLKEFRKFFDVTIDLMCIAGTDGYFKKTNPAFERELGWNEQELRERPFFDLVHPDDVEKTEHELAKLAEGIPTISFENRYRCKGGGYKRLRWTSYPEGDVLYAIAHVLDRSQAS